MKRNIPSRLISFAVILIIQTAFCFSQDKLSGTAAVSPTGAASYSIAIDAPKGVGDLMPSIGIAYNSQAGNGVVGFGCNITGLSAITRGMKTIAHDNSVKGISYDNNCALYLDGKRLLLKSGTEGTDGCIYAPEGEPLTNVTLHSSLSDTSCWFEIDTNDGMVYEYGHTDGRQFISSPSAVAAWHISKATNPMGQSITYQYNVDGLYLYPLTISYGGDNSVNFEYEARTDSVFFALRNNRGYIGKRLKSITTKAGNSTFRTYAMSYNLYDGSVTKFSRLGIINETGENGNSSHELSAIWNYLPDCSPTCQNLDISMPQSHYNEEYLNSYMLSNDVTGDGRDDIIRISNVKVTTGYEYNFKTYIQIFRSSHQNGNMDYDSPIIYKIPGSFKNEFRTCLTRGAIFGDLDGDGVKDVVIPIYHEDGVAYMNFKVIFGRDIIAGNIGNIYGTYSLPCESGIPLVTQTDLNNDGKTEILYLQKQESNGTYLCLLLYDDNGIVYTVPFNFSLSYSPKSFFTSDFNHDGLTDLIVISNSGYWIFYNKGHRQLDYTFEDNSNLNSSITFHDRMEQGDFNGDGILDFIWNDNNSSQLFFGIGNADGTFTCRQAYNLSFDVKDKNSDEGTWNCIVTDLDHDGKSDVVLNLAEYWSNGYYNKSHTYWLLSNGTSLTMKKESTSNRESDAKVGHIFAGDFKGNGYLEVANYGYDCYNGVNANTDPTVNIYSCSSQSISNGKVDYFRDSNGRKATFAYSSMTSDLVYTKGTGSSYPVIDVAAPLCVTSQISESGGSPITTQTNYTYKGLRAHLQGRGLLGFSEVTTTETNTGKSIKTTITSQDASYYVPTQTVVTTTQDGETTTIVNTMVLRTHITSSTIPNHNYLLLPLMKTDTDIYGHETVTNYTYDTSKHYLTFEYTEYDNDYNMFRQKQYSYSQNKIAGAYRPVSIIFTQMHPDGSQPFEKETEFTYDSYGRKTSVTEYPGESLELVTTYQYDDNGNITKEKYSGYGISNNTETNFQYSSDGKFLTQESTSARVVSYNRNVFGDIMSETDLTSLVYPQTTTYTRNGFGTLTKEQKSTGETTTWIRESTSSYGGCYSITTKPNNSPEVQTWYDALGNEVRTETTGIGGVEISTTNTYNACGQLTAKTSVHGSLTTTENYTYDGLGRVLTITSSDGGSVIYSYDDREVSTTKNGKTYIKDYDAWGNAYYSDDPVTYVSNYYHSNGKPREVYAGDSSVQIDYDDYGNQISLDDPDAGLTTYQYDALHRVISQTDARGIVTTFSYDGAGRITQKTVGGTTTTYTYGSTGNAVAAGRLRRVRTGGSTIDYAYDEGGRLWYEEWSCIMLDEPSLSFEYTYDNCGRLATKTYPQGVTVEYVYDGGHCIASKIDTTNICFTELDDGKKSVRRVGGRLRYGNPLSEPFVPMEQPINSGGTALPLGGGYPYYPLDPDDPVPVGPDDSIRVDPGLLGADQYYVSYPVLRHKTEFDTRGYLTKLVTERDSMTFDFQSGTGNLLMRTGMRIYEEEFAYDNLDRLCTVSSAIHQLMNISYSDNGNIYSKTGPGIYYYDSSHPHAVTSVANPNGSISSATQTATYTSFGKISTLSDNGYTLNVTYGPHEERRKTVLKYNGNTIRTTYYANDYERVTENGQTRHFYYLDGGVIYVLNDGETEGTFYYSFADHLGSITSIYDKNGTKVFSAYYDAWGKQTVTTNTLNFHRGYTGHEMLPEFGLINMNGRLYDPALGRFLSPDNYVQMPDFSQSFNRYSYCLNNPLKYTDPDGEWFGIDDLIISGAAFVMGYLSNGISSGNWGWSSVQAGLMNAGSAWLGYNTASLLGGSTPNTWNFIGSMGINTVANSIFPPMYIPITNHFGLSVSPAFGFGGDGFSGGLNVSAIYQNGDFTLSNTLGFTNNYYGAYSEIGIKDFHFGYGRTHYGSYNDVGSQTVGTFKLGKDNVSFALSNDLFGESHQDRWRTSAAELSIGNFSIGTYVITNDGQHESKALYPQSPTMVKDSPIIGLNNKMGAWKFGNVKMAPLWFGYRQGTNITRIGFSDKSIQALTQNLVHHTLVPTPDYTFYDSFYKGFTIYSGYNNPLSLWNR